jgi:hypothetical protein
MSTARNEKRRPGGGGASRQATQSVCEATISTDPSPMHAPSTFARRLPPGVAELVRMGRAEIVGLGFRLIWEERA